MRFFLKTKNALAGAFSSFPPCFQAKRRVSGRLEHRGWNKRLKTRLQLIIDLLTLFPACDFLPLPKQARDIIYFPCQSRFAIVQCGLLSWTAAYLLTRPHLGPVTSQAAAELQVSFSLIQKWSGRQGQGLVVAPLLMGQRPNPDNKAWQFNSRHFR